jgi:hypothetical protein
MEASAVDEKKLEDLIDKAVQKHLKLTFEDVEEVRRSPAGGIIRLETRLDAIDARLDRDMVTRAEFQETNGRINARFETMVTRAEFQEANGRINARLGKLEAQIETMVTRAEFQEANGQINTRLGKLEAQMVTRVEFKDEIWKLKLYILLLAALILLTNPTVLELFGKILGIIK